MSADNYYFVRPCDDGQWTFTMEFASDHEPGPVKENDLRFATWREAYSAASKAEEEEPFGTEYGIVCDPATENVGDKPGARHCASCTCE